MSETPDSFELARFAPPTGVAVTLRNGSRYRFPGDPDVDDVAILLRLESTINDVAGDDLANALQEGKDTLRRLILEADPDADVVNFKIGAEEMLVVFALLVHGSTVAEAVGAAITAANESSGERRDGETDEEYRERIALAAEVGDPDAPLSPSENSSSERSSGSADAEASLPATG